MPAAVRVDQTRQKNGPAADPRFARSHDGYRRDAFYRFNQSLQHFFDSSAKIETKFAS